jgi:hypothetical protein
MIGIGFNLLCGHRRMCPDTWQTDDTWQPLALAFNGEGMPEFETVL